MVANYNPLKYDLGILRQDGTTNVGLMLAQKNGVPIYGEFDDEYLAQQMFTSTPDYASLPAEKELAIRQDSWRAGYGLDTYDSLDPERYYSSRGMDLRFQGMAIPGPKSVALTLPVVTPVSLTDGALEVWTSETNLASWSEFGGGITRDTEFARSATNSARIVMGATRGFTQTLAWNNEYQSRVFRARVFAYSIKNNVYISLNDGVTTNISVPFPSVVNAWDYQWLSKTLATNATQLVVNCWVVTNGTGNVWLDDVELYPPTDAYPKVFSDYNSNVYMAKGNIVTKLASNGAAFSYLSTLPVNITDIEPYTDDLLYHAQGIANAYFSMNSAEGFAIASGQVNTFNFLKAVHSSSPVLWGNSTNYQIRSTTDPTNTALWSGVTNVGSSFYKITDLVSLAGVLHIEKEDMPYYLNASGAVQNDLAPELQSLSSATSGKNAFVWLNKLYIPAGNSLLEYNDGTNTWRSPADLTTSLSKFGGRVAGIAGDDRYLYLALNGTGVVQIVAARYEVIDNVTKWVVHPICEIPITACETLYISSVYQKRLYIASTNSSDSLYYIPLYSSYADPLTDTNRSFATNVEFETPWLHANFADTNKGAIRLDTILGHTYNTNRFFQAHYKTLENSSYSFIGNAVGTSARMVNTLYIPTAPTPTSAMFRLKFTANTDDNNVAPILKSYNLQAILYPPRRTIISCVARCSPEMTLRDGTTDKGSDAFIKTVLDEAANATYPVTFYDFEGTQQYVKFLPLGRGTPRWTIIRDEKGRTIEKQYNLLLQVVKLS